MEIIHRCIYLVNSPGTNYGIIAWIVRPSGDVDIYNIYVSYSYGSPDEDSWGHTGAFYVINSGMIYGGNFVAIEDSYGSPDPNNNQDLRVITFMGSIYAQHNAIQHSYGYFLRTWIVLMLLGESAFRVSSLIMVTITLSTIPTVIKTRE